MEKLIECSKAGVKIEFFIRGICCLRPGIEGMTENITVTSVVGRWLEHSRIYSFGEGEDQRMFIGSGDLLSRNLEHRVEAFIEVVTPDTREQINEVLNALRSDREKSRRMLPDGTYVRDKGGEGTSSQEALYRYFSAYKVNTEPPAPVMQTAPAAVSAPVEQTAPAAEPAPALQAAPAAEPVPVRSEPVAVEKAPIIAPPKALETTPPPEPVGLLRKIRSFARRRGHM